MCRKEKYIARWATFSWCSNQVDPHIFDVEYGFKVLCIIQIDVRLRQRIFTSSLGGWRMEPKFSHFLEFSFLFLYWISFFPFVNTVVLIELWKALWQKAIIIIIMPSLLNHAGSVWFFYSVVDLCVLSWRKQSGN